MSAGERLGMAVLLLLLVWLAFELGAAVVMWRRRSDGRNGEGDVRMGTIEDRLVLPAVDTSVALVPQRVISAERLGLKQAERRARRAREDNARLVGEQAVDRRIIETLERSVRDWSARHAATEARLRRWQTATWVIVVLALGYILVFLHVGH